MPVVCRWRCRRGSARERRDDMARLARRQHARATPRPLRISADRSPRVHLHRRHDRPVEGLRDQPQLRVTLADADRRHVGPRPDDVVWTPLPMFHFNAVSRAHRHVARRWTRRDLQQVLRLELLARDQPHRRHAGVHVRQHGHALANDPMRPEAPDPGRPERTRPCGSCRACRCRPPSARSASSGSGSARSTRGTAHRGQSLWCWLPPGWRTSRTRPAS